MQFKAIPLKITFHRTVCTILLVYGGWGSQVPAFQQHPISATSFEIQELPTRLTVGYAVRCLDVNADGHIDIAIVDSKRVLWLEGPSWKEHVIYSTPDAPFDNVCFAPLDINQDGRIDFALGSDWQFNNTTGGGEIGWLEHVPDQEWRYHHISHEPTTHRMQWADLFADGKWRLVVGPLKGRGSMPPGFDQKAIRLLAFEPTLGADENVSWLSRVLNEQLHVMHNFDVVDWDGDGKQELLAASFEGVSLLQADGPMTRELSVRRLGSGYEAPAPNRGASEIRLGHFVDGSRYIATIEPWHGDRVVVYTPPNPASTSEEDAALWTRRELDAQLAWGHAVATANLDDDQDDELIVGVRDNLNGEHRCGLRIYDPIDAKSGHWNRILVDPGGVAIEDLAVADLDGDGRMDIVAVGRATHNIKIYWNRSSTGRSSNDKSTRGP